MIWGLRSQAAGRKSRPSGYMAGIIKIRSIAPQYETKGINPLGLVRKLCCSTTSYFTENPTRGLACTETISFPRYLWEASTDQEDRALAGFFQWKSGSLQLDHYLLNLARERELKSTDEPVSMPMLNRSTIENFSGMRPTFRGGGKYRTNRRIHHLPI